MMKKQLALLAILAVMAIIVVGCISLKEPAIPATTSPTPTKTVITTVPTTAPTTVRTTDATIVPTTARVTTVPTKSSTLNPSADVRIVGEKTIPEGPYYIHMVEVTSSTGFKGVIGTTFSYNEMGADMPLGVELEPGQTDWFEYRRGTVADRVPVDLGLKITYIKG